MKRRLRIRSIPTEDTPLHDIIKLSGGEPRCPDIGTKDLMLAVLEGGIREYCDMGGRSTEGEDWVRSDRREAFSFAVVCETLGLEPTAVRQALLRLKQEGALRLARIRPNLRKRRPTANSG